MIVLSFPARAGQENERWLACRLASLSVGRWVNEADPTYPTARPALPRMTRVPEEVARLLAPLKPYFRYRRHYAVLCWREACSPASAPPGGGTLWHRAELKGEDIKVPPTKTRRLARA